MSIKAGIISLLFFSLVSSSYGQNQSIVLKKVQQSMIQKSDLIIPSQKLKFTLSDSWFSRDKTHHFLTSAFLSSAGYYFLREEQQYSNSISQQGGICFSLSLGVIKEIRDGFKPNNAFSVKDLVADILGTAVGILLVSDL